MANMAASERARSLSKCVRVRVVSGTELSILHIGILTSKMENIIWASFACVARLQKSSSSVISLCVMCSTELFFFSAHSAHSAFLVHNGTFSSFFVFHQRAIQCKVWASETNNIYSNVQRSENSRKVEKRKRRTKEGKKQSRANLYPLHLRCRYCADIIFFCLLPSSSHSWLTLSPSFA